MRSSPFGAISWIAWSSSGSWPGWWRSSRAAARRSAAACMRRCRRRPRAASSLACSGSWKNSPPSSDRCCLPQPGLSSAAADRRSEPDRALLLGRVPAAESECGRRQARARRWKTPQLLEGRECLLSLMANLTGAERARYVQGMFSRIARRYDLMNRVMTGGQDVRWRREVIRLAELPPDGWLLDLGAGTGDLAREALRQQPAGHSPGRRFHPGDDARRAGTLPVSCPSPQSGCTGRPPMPPGCHSRKDLSTRWSRVSCCAMSVTCQRCLAEQYRVLKPGGRLVALDTTPPPHTLLRPLIRFHLHTVIPTLGRLIAGQAEAYHYLPELNRKLPGTGAAGSPPAGSRLRAGGLSAPDVRHIAIHWGQKARSRLSRVDEMETQNAAWWSGSAGHRGHPGHPPAGISAPERDRDTPGAFPGCAHDDRQGNRLAGERRAGAGDSFSYKHSDIGAPSLPARFRPWGWW